MRFAEESSARQSISISYRLEPCSDRRTHKPKLSVLLMCQRASPGIRIFHENGPRELSSPQNRRETSAPSFQIRKRLSSENLNRTPFCKRRKSFTRPSIHPQAKELQALPPRVAIIVKAFRLRVATNVLACISNKKRILGEQNKPKVIVNTVLCHPPAPYKGPKR